MDKSLVTNFSKLINADENQDNTNKPKVSYVYGQVVDIMSDGKVAVVNIDGSTIRCPMKSNVTVSEGNRVMVMLRQAKPIVKFGQNLSRNIYCRVKI